MVAAAPPFGAASVTGIDMDRELIRRAQSHLSFQGSRIQPGRQTELTRDSMHYFPVSSVLDHGHQPPSQGGSEQDQALFPNNVSFACEDWAVHLPSPFSTGERKYDTILALSVIKWIHLQHHDTGLRRFFLKCNLSLRLGGHLVLEIQPWQSYEKAIKPNKSPHLAENLALLEIRPEEHFDSLLEELGLAMVATSDALPRRISIYQKVKDLHEELAFHA
ncbi:MAG: hypothetical protein M1816_004282 [Peltula sp. TS41687]|nr:MAG: hypothetical protein M1816_004282 [Peltula sp. TS41687]